MKDRWDKDFLHKRLDVFVTALMLMVMALIEVLDISTGREWSLWVLYLGPVGLSAWALGFSYAWPLMVVAAGLQMAEALLVGHVYSGWVVYLFALCCRVVAMWAVAWLCNRLRHVEELEHKLSSYQQLCDNLNIDLPDGGAGRSS